MNQLRGASTGTVSSHIFISLLAESSGFNSAHCSRLCKIEIKADLMLINGTSFKLNVFKNSLTARFNHAEQTQTLLSGSSKAIRVYLVVMGSGGDLLFSSSKWIKGRQFC